MRSIEEFQKLNEEIRAAWKGLEMQYRSDNVQKKVNKAIKQNDKCIEALRGGIKEENVRKDLENLENEVETIMNKYNEWYGSTPGTNELKTPVTYYRRVREIPKKEKMIKFMQYLLR